MPFYDAAASSSTRQKVDTQLAYFFADSPAVAQQIALVAALCPLHGYYFQLGTNKAGSAFMFALKKEGANIVWYAADSSTFMAEFAEVLVHLSEKEKAFANELQICFKAAKETLGELWTTNQ